jgi:hypothetical protein
MVSDNEEQKLSKPAAKEAGELAVPAVSVAPDSSAAQEFSTEATGVAETSAASVSAVETETEATAEAAAQTDAVAPTDTGGHPLPPHLQPIPEEKLARARRGRRILITALILLVLVLLGTVAAGAYFYLTLERPSASINVPAASIAIDDRVDDRGTGATIEMPNLRQMFGQTPEEVAARLGPEYVITNTDVSAASGSTSGDAATDTSGTDTDATQANATAAVVTISYTPTEQQGTVGTAQVQNIYLSLDQTGVTREVYLVSSMNLLDYPISSFAQLVASRSSFVATLASAGIAVSSDLPYTAPSAEDYTEYVDAEASVKKVRKETASMSGSLTSDQPPTSFEVTYTYDYGASGVEATPDRQPSQRMIYLNLR